jgi:hypothetical protein
MRGRTSEDTPSYAAETVASAHLSGPYLAASSGLFLALLAAMSLMESPILPSTASGVETLIRSDQAGSATASVAGAPSACAGTRITTFYTAGAAPGGAG